MVKAAILEDVRKLKIVDYPPTQFGTVLQLMRLAQDRIPLDKVVTHKFKVEDAQKSIDTLKSRQGIKHVLVG